MSTAALYLGLDCGTQGTKALILDSHSGAVLGLGAAPHSLISGANGRREQDPGQWLQACISATHQALQVAGV
ncbi:FGGY family carbohydrate kinase, partial [Pseudomonas protegens]